MKATDAICSNEWAIREDVLRLMVRIASRESPLDQDTVTALMNPRAVSTQDGLPLQGADTIEVRDGVAVIPVSGPIMRYATLFSRISGATSIQTIARDFGLALNNPAVKAILLNIDSPGGQVNGADELSNIIRAARGTKPIYAYASNEMASAAYWIGSAADKIIAAPSAIVGSIGVVAAIPNPKTDPESQTTIEIVSSQSPKKRVDVTTKEGKSQIQTVVDSLAQVFVDTVALNRNVSPDHVIDNYGSGDVFVGKQALDAGMVDAIGSFESTIADLSGTKSQPKKEVKAMGLREQMMAILNGTPADDETPVTPTAETKPVITEKPTQPITASDRERALEAENRRLRLDRYTAEATAFADVAINEERAFPAEREALIETFIQASFDDQQFGASTEDGKSRVSMLKNLLSLRPKHMLTAESLVPALANMARLPAAPTSDADKPLTDDQLKEMLGQTPLGQSVLSALNGSAK